MGQGFRNESTDSLSGEEKGLGERKVQGCSREGQAERVGDQGRGAVQGAAAEAEVWWRGGEDGAIIPFPQKGFVRRIKTDVDILPWGMSASLCVLHTRLCIRKPFSLTEKGQVLGK